MTDNFLSLLEEGAEKMSSDEGAEKMPGNEKGSGTIKIPQAHMHADLAIECLAVNGVFDGPVANHCDFVVVAGKEDVFFIFNSCLSEK
jgi:hypothetical protein